MLTTRVNYQLTSVQTPDRLHYRVHSADQTSSVKLTDVTEVTQGINDNTKHGTGMLNYTLQIQVFQSQQFQLKK